MRQIEGSVHKESGGRRRCAVSLDRLGESKHLKEAPLTKAEMAKVRSLGQKPQHHQGPVRNADSRAQLKPKESECGGGAQILTD